MSLSRCFSQSLLRVMYQTLHCDHNQKRCYITFCTPWISFFLLRTSLWQTSLVRAGLLYLLLLYLPGLLHGSNLPMNVRKTQPQRLVGMIAGACWLFFVPGRWWRPRFLRSTGQRIRSAKYSRRFMCYINHRVAPRTVLHGTCFITITDDCRR